MQISQNNAVNNVKVTMLIYSQLKLSVHSNVLILLFQLYAEVFEGSLKSDQQRLDTLLNYQANVWLLTFKFLV